MEPSDLLERARSRSSDPADPLETLSAAIALGMESPSDADPLIDLAVRQARDAGSSWIAIIERFRIVRHPIRRRRFTPAFAHRHLANRQRKRDAACSFCRRPPGPRVHMVHGEGGRICDRCVALAGQIVAELNRRRG
ncbi:ClpX C4-type zinc finger protein [Sphaerimonospora sp. CA-214678]|uniref:ClpX C4-type zinc finger protein n=1 Tax=Sphaerimonospora sp. CA-214678 TaxID=3240029 RepID=UPI003D930FAC